MLLAEDLPLIMLALCSYANSGEKYELCQKLRQQKKLRPTTRTDYKYRPVGLPEPRDLSSPTGKYSYCCFF